MVQGGFLFDFGPKMPFAPQESFNCCRENVICVRNARRTKIKMYGNAAYNYKNK